MLGVQDKIDAGAATGDGNSPRSDGFSQIWCELQEDKSLLSSQVCRIGASNCGQLLHCSRSHKAHR